MQIPLVDLQAQYQTIKHEVRAAFEDVLEHMQLFLGPHSRAFENEFAAYCECEFGVGLSSSSATSLCQVWLFARHAASNRRCNRTYCLFTHVPGAVC